MNKSINKSAINGKKFFFYINTECILHRKVEI